MDIDQLRTFDRIARDLSFTKAAARLNVTQATVSMRMRVLEDTLGVQLFARGRKIALTDQGMTFLPYARRILNTVQEGREALRRVERGRITLGSLRSLVTPLISDSLLRFQASHKDVDVIVMEGHHHHVTAMLHDRSVELGIIAWPNLDPLVPELYPLLVMREPVPLVLAPRLAAKLSPRPLLSDVLALVPRVISLRWWQVDPEGATALVRRAQTSVEIPTGPARKLALAGEGLGFFVRSAIAEQLASGELVEIKPRDFEPLHRDIAAVALSKAALERDMVRDFAGEIAIECAKLGTILENRLDQPNAARAAAR
ncbi:LysR family transcriptional regulator [Pelagibacterium xiamenense]|uniref:LysR family transcriptional regulator n=1 Tax=Pelagibacterium xiamenense TaxID=2901140 RepID=UPI001E42B1FB|nr:LysR family transcriptional regulator [Pelagibacterium xiamenense]MCD7058749.1 LysR family transcriptional regulator [Pelagibacterium xiamenense]